MAKLKDKVVWITGASSGIGEAIARALPQSKLILTARRGERLERLQEELGPDRVEVCVGDVTQDLHSVLEPGVRRFGTLDVVIANAGFGVVARVEDLKIEDLHRQLDVNLYGVIRTIQCALPELKKSKGRIGIVGSVNGYVALPGNPAYAMSKFAVRALSDALRSEVAADGISVTHIAPGFVESEIRRVNNAGELREDARDRIPDWLQMPASKAARIIVGALARRKSEQVFTGHGRFAVCMARHCPRLLGWLILRLGIRARPEAKP